jgi:hypothetical protein
VAGLFCSCFIVLRHPSEDHDFRNSQQVRLELWRMDLELPVKLLEELKNFLLLDNIVPSNALQSQNIAILQERGITRDNASNYSASSSRARSPKPRHNRILIPTLYNR